MTPTVRFETVTVVIGF
ncbi:hypothetical protein A2U01_0097224, partial [Trifolium medium]|nr:hypothetical protein [Trifolium medium]